ncbi:MAG: protein kinase UbiB [candidate division WS6 bacterium OLB20]|uniref:Protein kinase UbiB n=1 Tax=candidate division WS6 bacterium OLB20 TaxID=1617426 RepID=A0A136LYL0_9BACT|nr:MAG: protein kinase UbiB [candidate division WS6 bacterium OLB20]
MTDTLVPVTRDFSEGKVEQNVQSISEQEKGSSLSSMHIESVSINSGEPLDPQHPFHRLVASIYDKLHHSESTLVCLDSDQATAYNATFARVTLLSRGLLARMQEIGFEVHEDHIAALLAHEENHAIRNQGLEKKSDQKQIRNALTYKAAGHAEEHQSDRMAMVQIAEAGYNPRAMIDVLEVFRQQYGDNSSGSHPFLTDRINHLKRIMFDDERPLAGTDREYVQIPTEVTDWIMHGDKDVYQFTDSYLEKTSVPEVVEAMQSASSASEYLQLLRYKRHLERGQISQQLKDTGVITDLVRKSLALNALRAVTDVVSRGHKRDPEIENFTKGGKLDFYPRVLVDTSLLTPERRSANYFMVEHDDYGKQQPTSIATQRFLQDKDRSGLELEDEQKAAYIDMTTDVVEVWDAGFEKLRADHPELFQELTPEEESVLIGTWEQVLLPVSARDADPRLQKLMTRKMLSKISRYYDGDSPIDQELVSLALLSYGSDYTERMLIVNRTEDPEKITARRNRIIDFDSEWRGLLDALTDSVAMRVAIPTTPTYEDTLPLAAILEKEYGISTDLSSLAAQGLLYGYEGLEETVLGLSDDQKVQLVRIYQDASLVTSGRLSSRNESHMRYRESLYDLGPESDRKGMGFGSNELDTPALINKEWGSYIIQVLMDSRYKDGKLPIMPNATAARCLVGSDSIRGLDMTSEELEGLTLIDSQLDTIYRAKALEEYLQLRQQGLSIPSHIMRSFNSTFGEMTYASKDALVYSWPNYIKLRTEEVDILIADQPWGEPETRHFLISHYATKIGPLSPFTLVDRQPDPEALELFNQHVSRFNRLDWATSEHEHETYKQLAEDRITIREKIISSYLKYAYLEQKLETGGGYVSQNELSGVLKPKTVARAINLAQQNGIGCVVGDYVVATSLGINYGNSIIMQYIREADPDDLELVASSIGRGPEKGGIQIQDYIYAMSAVKRRGANNGDLAILMQSMLSGSEFGNNPFGSGVIRDVLDIYGGPENTLKFVTSRTESSYYLARVGALAVQKLSPERRIEGYRSWMSWMVSQGIPVDAAVDFSSLKTKHARTTAFYPHTEHERFLKRFDRHELITTTQGDFDDLFTRRMPFHSTGMTVDDFHVVSGKNSAVFPGFRDYYHNRIDELRSQGLITRDTKFSDYPYTARPELVGSAPQQIVAEMLQRSLDYLQSDALLEERLAVVNEVCPLPALAKDIHLERMLRESLQKEPVEMLREVDLLIPLFSSKELLTQYMESIITRRLESGLYSTDESVELVLEFFPEASLSRNSLLDNIVETSRVSTELLTRVASLRLSEEFEDEQSDEASPAMSIMNHALNTTKRKERRETVLWLLRMQQKPKHVDIQEVRLDGSLGSAPTAFLTMNELQRTEVIERLLLGSQGVMEVLTDQKQQATITEALEERKLFLDRFAEVLIPDSISQYALFRDVFVSVMEESDPVRSTQIIGKLINKKIEAEKAGRKLEPEQALADALCLAGVVGKKVAQSLAELDIDEKYKQALALSQEQADAVPKRAQYELAKQEGLISGVHGIRIVSFGDNIGAASNKQASIVTIEIVDQEAADHFGVEIGDQIEAVGKFKRPSAQKVDNLRNDLRILNGVMRVLERHNVAQELPPNFVDQIRIAVEGELKFAAEAVFNERVSNNISRRPTFGSLKLQTPDVLFASDNVIIETRAPGRSLRSLADGGEHIDLVQKARGAVLSEIIYELLETGEIHADLHPGNIFVDPDTDTLTFIDLGMNVTISNERLPQVRKLFVGLLLGDRKRIADSLIDLGWNADVSKMDVAGKGAFRGAAGMLIKRLSGGRVNTETSLDTVFVNNIMSLLRASQLTESPPPEDVSLLIFALSKMEPYMSAATVPNLLRIARRVASSK